MAAEGIVSKLRYIVANVKWRHDQTISITIIYAPLAYPKGGNRKRSEQSMSLTYGNQKLCFLPVWSMIVD